VKRESSCKRAFMLLVAVISALICVAAPAATPYTPDTSHQQLPVVRLADLPYEARQTVRLIRRGGPFPYERDGVVFGNFERLLPRRERGYYREYTVPTPALDHRGARRIVMGRGGELYFTDDHYRSFRQVRE
jgi:ribonuclease T1